MSQLLALFALVAMAVPVAAAEKDFSSWRKFTEGRLIAETTSLAPGASGHIGLHITLADHWHTYWVNPGDSGAAINLNFKNSPGVRVKKVKMPVPERFKTGPLISFAYGKEVVFPIEVEIDPSVAVGSAVQIQVDAEWLVCEDVCIPAIDTLALPLSITNEEDVRPGPEFGLMQKYLARIPKPLSDAPKFEFSADSALLRIRPWPEGMKFVDFFPFRGSGVTNEPPNVEIADNAAVLKFKTANVPPAAPDRVGVLIWADAKDGDLVEAVQIGEPKWTFSEDAGSSAPTTSLWWMLLSAFLGGLILNLMPCVFPVLSIKLLSLLKVSVKSASLIRQQNAGYVLGVLVSFLAIGLSLSVLRQAGHLVGWGFQLQSPIFLAVLSWVFLAFALNLAGYFEIEFIDAGIGGRWTKLGGFWGSFFTGVLAVVVASPCTAPFMGVALGFGLSQPTPVLLAIFLALGLGLASPYALMMAVPSALWFLPKPGPWMVRLKQFMAIPMLLTIGWLLWVLLQISGGRGVAAVLAGCAVLALVILFGRKRRRVAGFLAATVLAGLLGVVYSTAEVPDSAPDMQSEWQPYSEADLAGYAGQNVFINMTADWCLTCKVNERLIFADGEILALLKEKNVKLIMGDWTKPNPEITRFLNKYGRAGVPFYVFFSPRNPQGRILPEVMTKSTFMELVREEFP